MLLTKVFPNSITKSCSSRINFINFDTKLAQNTDLYQIAQKKCKIYTTAEIDANKVPKRC